MAKTRSPYPEEFRREAVELVRSSPDRSVPEIAKSLGVSGQSLRNWVRQAEIGQGQREGLSSEEREELRRLRRENRTLRQEEEVLAKATAFFAGESDHRQRSTG